MPKCPDWATVMLVIDVSLSMNSADVTPTRLAAAQDAAISFVHTLPPGINLGLESFAGLATVLVSPTTNRDLAVRAIHTLKLADSTATGDALAAALAAIDEVNQLIPGQGQGPPPARIVLMSDGKQNTGRDEFDVAAQSGAAHIPISTISLTPPMLVVYPVLVLLVGVVLAFLPTSCRWAGWRFLVPGGRPGPGREGFGALAGWVVFGRRLRNPRRMRAGVSRCGSVTGFSHGRRRSLVRWRASRSWVWAATMIQVQRLPWSGVRMRGRVQPRVCLRNRKVCSRSKRRRKARHRRFRSALVSSGREYHSHTGLGLRSPGSRSTWSRMMLPSMMGSGPW
jgi:hypothetical protein